MPIIAIEDTKTLEFYPFSCLVIEDNITAPIERKHNWYDVINKEYPFVGSTQNLEPTLQLTFSTSASLASPDEIDCQYWVKEFQKHSHDAWDRADEDVFLITAKGKHSIDTVFYYRSVHPEIVSPEEYYNRSIFNLRNVKAVIYEDISNIRHFMTILSERDLEVREEIYKVEMKMFELYPEKQFSFSIICSDTQSEIDLLIKNKNILFYR